MQHLSEPFVARWTRRICAASMAALGLLLIAGGTILLLERGSGYYLCAGLAVAASGILIGRRDRRGIWLYNLFLLVTLTWSIYEVGLDGWGLLPRLAAPAKSSKRAIDKAATEGRNLFARPVRTLKETREAF